MYDYKDVKIHDSVQRTEKYISPVHCSIQAFYVLFMIPKKYFTFVSLSKFSNDSSNFSLTESAIGWNKEGCFTLDTYQTGHSLQFN